LHEFPAATRERQESATMREGSTNAPRPRRPPERRPVRGLLLLVSVLQHCTVPVSHSLTVGGLGGGNKPPLATGVTEAATLLAAAKAARKETRGL